ncbi:hypothetical protein BB561_006832 [Smittium simulii]|uniref:Uncharacterized protein n=1 Tax=Smittium simulii TaxID=133385 RepID=A0A2T9Y138_9FUNG|nr:hypothetical protein BB561_006832 [Smittium simulii]
MQKLHRLAKRQSMLGLVTRSFTVVQNTHISFAAALWRNQVRPAIFNSKNNLITALNFRKFSSKEKDTNLLGVNKFEQMIPTRESMKSLKSNKYTRDISINEESNEDNSQSPVKNKFIELPKPKQSKKSKLLKAQKLIKLQKAKLHKAQKLLKLKKAKFLEAQKLLKLKKAKFLEAQKLKKAKLLEKQKLRQAKQASSNSQS